MFLYETHIGWKSLSFGQLPDDGREFGKGNPGFWICLCFCLLSPEIYFSNESLFFFIVMVVIMNILLVISSVKVPWQNRL